jgi:hypothetical protein
VTLLQENQLLLSVSDLVVVSEMSMGTMVGVEWPASPQGDLIADSVVGIISQFLSIPSTLRQLTLVDKGGDNDLLPNKENTS